MEEDRLANVDSRLIKMEAANAKVKNMIEAKEQQAMLQEKVAEKLWDLRR